MAQDARGRRPEERLPPLRQPEDPTISRPPAAQSIEPTASAMVRPRPISTLTGTAAERDRTSSTRACTRVTASGSAPAAVSDAARSTSTRFTTCRGSPLRAAACHASPGPRRLRAGCPPRRTGGPPVRASHVAERAGPARARRAAAPGRPTPRRGVHSPVGADDDGGRAGLRRRVEQALGDGPGGPDVGPRVHAGADGRERLVGPAAGLFGDDARDVPDGRVGAAEGSSLRTTTTTSSPTPSERASTADQRSASRPRSPPS